MSNDTCTSALVSVLIVTTENINDSFDTRHQSWGHPHLAKGVSRIEMKIPGVYTSNLANLPTHGPFDSPENGRLVLERQATFTNVRNLSGEVLLPIDLSQGRDVESLEFLIGEGARR